MIQIPKAERPVYDYDVELKLTNPNTGEVKQVTFPESAYGVQDAMMQGLIRALCAYPLLSDVKVVSVQPSSAALLASRQEIAKMASGVMNAIGRSMKPPQKAKETT